MGESRTLVVLRYCESDVVVVALAVFISLWLLVVT